MPRRVNWFENLQHVGLPLTLEHLLYLSLLQTVVPGNPVDDFKLLARTVSSLVRANALRSGKGINVSFGSKSNEEKVQMA
jgi:hypothetical protein